MAEIKTAEGVTIGLIFPVTPPEAPAKEPEEKPRRGRKPAEK